jgi:hypothetical protein
MSFTDKSCGWCVSIFIDSNTNTDEYYITPFSRRSLLPEKYFELCSSMFNTVYKIHLINEDEFGDKLPPNSWELY